MSDGSWAGGKGSKPRKVNRKKFDDNFDRIFGNQKPLENVENCKNGEELGIKLLQAVKEMKAQKSEPDTQKKAQKSD
jgi:hypothetical protein